MYEKLKMRLKRKFDSEMRQNGWELTEPKRERLGVDEVGEHIKATEDSPASPCHEAGPDGKQNSK